MTLLKPLHWKVLGRYVFFAIFAAALVLLIYMVRIVKAKEYTHVWIVEPPALEIAPGRAPVTLSDTGPVNEAQ